MGKWIEKFISKIGDIILSLLDSANEWSKKLRSTKIITILVLLFGFFMVIKLVLANIAKLDPILAGTIITSTGALTQIPVMFLFKWHQDDKKNGYVNGTNGNGLNGNGGTNDLTK